MKYQTKRSRSIFFWWGGSRKDMDLPCSPTVPLTAREASTTTGNLLSITLRFRELLMTVGHPTSLNLWLIGDQISSTQPQVKTNTSSISCKLRAERPQRPTFPLKTKRNFGTYLRNVTIIMMVSSVNLTKNTGLVSSTKPPKNQKFWKVFLMFRLPILIFMIQMIKCLKFHSKTNREVKRLRKQ